MDDERRRPDPTSRPDPYELAVQRAASAEAGEPGPEDGAGTPPLPRLHVGPFRVGPAGLLVGVVLLVGVGTLVRFGGDRSPALPPSCTQPGLALSVQRVHPGGLVEYAVRGADGEVVLSVLPRAADGTLGPPEQVLPPVTLVRCRARSRFGIQAPTGEHTVVVTRGGRPVARADVTVTDPRDPVVG